MTDVDLHPRDPVAAPRSDAGQEPGTGGVDAKPTALARQAIDPAARLVDDTSGPLPAPPQQAERLARREMPEPTADLQSSVSNLPRRVNRPAAVPRSSAESSETAAGLEQPSSMQPHVVISRREIGGPQAFLQPSPELKSAAAAEVGKLNVARTDRSAQPQIASAPLKVLGRATDQAGLPSAVAAEALQAAAGAGQAPGSSAPGDGSPAAVAPAEVSVARGQADSPLGEGEPGALSAGEAPQVAAGPPLAGSPVARAETSSAPSLTPQAAAGGTVARATIARYGRSVAREHR